MGLTNASTTDNEEGSQMSRLLAAVATLLALCLLAPVAPAAAVADPYAPKIPTEIEITIVGKPGPGKPIKVQLKVSTNSDSDQPVQGTLKIQVRRVGQEALASGGSVQTMSYNGGQIAAVLGARSVGDYIVTAEFTPSDPDVYLGSTAERHFTVAAAGVAGNDDADGILPNTGGPGLWWLLLAALLVAGGAGAVVASRRRTATA